MKDLSLEMRLRNNRLRERRLSLGLTNRALADAADIDPGIYGALEGMKRSPMNKKTGTWIAPVLRLADYFKVAPGELFPAVVFDVVVPVTEVKLDGEDVGLLMEQMQGALLSETSPSEWWSDTGLDMALKSLTPREADAVNRYFGLTGDDGSTLENIGQMWGVSRTRAQRILLKALRKLRHPSRANLITEGESPEISTDDLIVRCKYCKQPITRKSLNDRFCCPCGRTLVPLQSETK